MTDLSKWEVCAFRQPNGRCEPEISLDELKLDTSWFLRTFTTWSSRQNIQINSRSSFLVLLYLSLGRFRLRDRSVKKLLIDTRPAELSKTMTASSTRNLSPTHINGVSPGERQQRSKETEQKYMNKTSNKTRPSPTGMHAGKNGNQVCGSYRSQNDKMNARSCARCGEIFMRY